MSGLIATARAELADALTDALASFPRTVRVFTEMPSVITPPCIVIGERTPLAVSDNSAPRTFTVQLEAVLLAATAGAANMVETADQLADHIIEALLDTDLAPLSVASYSILTAADQQPYLAARIPVALGPYTIEKQGE